MKNKQKILIVHNFYKIPGGEDTVVAHEQQLLQSHGHDVFFYSKNNNEIDNLSFLQKLKLPINFIFSISTYKDIKKIIVKHNINIVHVHNTLSLISPSVYYAAFACGIPVVQTIHNFRLLCPGATFYRNENICEDCLKKGLRYALKNKCYRNNRFQTLACVICIKFYRIIGLYKKLYYICLTDFNKEKLSNLAKKDNIFVKPNFIQFDKEIIPEDKRSNQYVFAGRLDKLKGIDILFKAWKKMGLNAPKLIVCGIGPMEKWCREFIKKNKVNIEMKGFVSNDEVINIIAHSKALILPTQWYEGFPMNIVESYAVGTPVIGSNIGNTGHLIINGVTGYTFNSNSINEIVNSINKPNHMFSSTFLEYKKKYTEEINYKILKDIYDKISNKFTRQTGNRT